jgi:hypothetical protein
MTYTGDASMKMTTNLTSKGRTADGAPKTAVKQRRTRARLGRVLPPTDRAPEVRHGVIDGAPVVWVELSGRHGQGNAMLLDKADWDWIEPTSPWWVVVTHGNGGIPFIATGRKPLNENAGQSPTSHANLPLVRLLTGAIDRGLTVWHRGRNPFNLRRCNLELVSRQEALARGRDVRWIMRDVDVDAIDWRLNGVVV